MTTPPARFVLWAFSDPRDASSITATTVITAMYAPRNPTSLRR
jgi:hypothetical protein